MLHTTPAVILHAFPYGETSRIVKLATRDFGVQSAMAKGARRPRSKFGASLETLSEGTAFLYIKPQRELQTLSQFDVMRQRPGLASDLKRYAAASAVAEIVMRFAPADPHPEIFDLLVAMLDLLSEAPASDAPAVSLVALWSMVAILGFAPSLDSCAVCGVPVPEPSGFALNEGGFVCARCVRGLSVSKLSAPDCAALRAFVAGDPGPGRDLPDRHLRAHRRLFIRFTGRHVNDGRALKALDLWEAQ